MDANKQVPTSKPERTESAPANPADTRGMLPPPKNHQGDYLGGGRTDPWTGEPLRKLEPQQRRGR